MTGIGLPLQGSWVLASVPQMPVSSLLSLSPSLAPPSWLAPCLSPQLGAGPQSPVAVALLLGGGTCWKALSL